MSKVEFPMASIEVGDPFVSPTRERVEVPLSAFERYQNERNARLKVVIGKTKDNPTVYPPKYQLKAKNQIVEEHLANLAKEIRAHFPHNQRAVNQDDEKKTENIWELSRPATIYGEKVSVQIVLTGGNIPADALKTSIFVGRKNFGTYLEVDNNCAITKTKGELNSELPVNGSDLIFWTQVTEPFKNEPLEE